MQFPDLRSGTGTALSSAVVQIQAKPVSLGCSWVGFSGHACPDHISFRQLRLRTGDATRILWEDLVVVLRLEDLSVAHDNANSRQFGGLVGAAKGAEFLGLVGLQVSDGTAMVLAVFLRELDLL